MAHSIEVFRARLRHWARTVLAPSPLYQRIAAGIDDDAPLLAIAAGRREPLLLFAAVQWLLLGGTKDAEVARYYPSVSGLPPADPRDAYAPFRRFVLAHEEAIAAILASRSMNRMEVRRSAALRFLVAEAAARLGAGAVHLVDIGCSAGANLLLDRWEIPIELRGDGRPPSGLPKILQRVGVDRVRVDIADPAEERWILAMLLPEDLAGHALARQAFVALRAAPPDIRIGDAAAELPRIVAGLSADAPIVFMHSAFMAYLDAGARRALHAALRAAAADRPCARVFLEERREDAVIGLALPAWASARAFGSADLDCRWLAWKPA